MLLRVIDFPGLTMCPLQTDSRGEPYRPLSVRACRTFRLIATEE